MSHFFTLAFVQTEMTLLRASAILDQINIIMTFHTTNLLGPNNDNVRWDSWRIGGRYNGLLVKHAAMTDCDNDLLRLLGEPLDNNICRVSNLSDELVPFAIVTPDGHCHVEGKMSAFGVSHDHDPYWEDKYDALRERFADCLAVGLDCHI